MRNLEECREEIFKRSKKRIQKRKKIRNCVFALGTPLALCVLVFVVMVSGNLRLALDSAEDGEMILQDANLPNQDATDVEQSNSESMVVSYSLVEIEELGVSEPNKKQNKKITDEVEIIQIWSFIHTLYEEQKVTDMVVDENESKDDSVSDNQKQETSYEIVFSTEEGTFVIYVLRGNCLMKQSTGEGIILSKHQLGRLKEIMKIF